jgi:ankyrin repeat protein
MCLSTTRMEEVPCFLSFFRASSCCLFSHHVNRTYPPTTNISATPGLSLLMAAASVGNFGFVEGLLSLGADIDLVDKGNESALMKACDGGHTHCARLLVVANVSHSFRQQNARVVNLIPVTLGVAGHRWRARRDCFDERGVEWQGRISFPPAAVHQ